METYSNLAASGLVFFIVSAVVGIFLYDRYHCKKIEKRENSKVKHDMSKSVGVRLRLAFGAALCFLVCAFIFPLPALLFGLSNIMSAILAGLLAGALFYRIIFSYQVV